MIRTLWTTRRASLRDKDAIADLCRAAVGEDDYVLPILEDLILRAVTYVALDGARVIGAMSYQEIPDGSAWLSAARTHPDYRQEGVATDLVKVLEGIARMKGVACLRLWTSASNVAGQASFKKAGFHEVARFTRMQAKASKTKGTLRLEPLRFTEDLWAKLESSGILRKSNAYTAIEYVFLPINRPNAHMLANRGLLWGWGGNGILLTDAAETGEEILELEPMFGALSAILRAAPAIAKARGKASVESFLPHDAVTLKAARAAGFVPMAWGQEAILCEKPLDVAKVVKRARKTYAEIAASKRSGYATVALLAPSGHGHGPAGLHEDRWNR